MSHRTRKIEARNPDEACAQLARRQHGVIGRFQALERGMSDDRIAYRLRTHRWLPALPSTYVLAGSPTSKMQTLSAITVWAGPKAAISHTSAAWMLRLPDFSWETPHASTTRRLRGGGFARIHIVSCLPPEWVIRLDDIPITDAAKTLIDIVALADEATVERALDGALRRQLTSVARLRWALAHSPAPRRRGMKTLAGLVEDRAPGGASPDSPFETDVLALIRRAGLPDPVPQYEVRDAGRLVARVDFAYPELRLAIEAHSYEWHSGHKEWERDHRRSSALRDLNWDELPVTWGDVHLRARETCERLRRARKRTQRRTGGRAEPR